MSELSGEAKKVHARPNGNRGTLLGDKTASGIIVMSTLVKAGATAGSVSPTASASTGDEPMGFALYSEFEDNENSSPYYADGSPLSIETLVPGMVLNLIAAENFAEGAIGEATTGGQVRALGGSSTVNRRFMANTAITAGDRGEFIVI